MEEYTTEIINWKVYHFYNRYTRWKSREEIEEQLRNCIVPFELFELLRE